MEFSISPRRATPAVDGAGERCFDSASYRRLVTLEWDRGDFGSYDGTIQCTNRSLVC